MAWYLYLVSLSMVAIAATYIMYPESFTDITRSLFIDINPRYLAIAPLVVGILFLLSRPWARSATLVTVLGLLGLLKGALLLLAPRSLMRDYLDWWCLRASPQAHRLLGLIMFALGVTLFYQIV